MLTSDKFFESFDKAGFLKPASWTPSFGGGPFTGEGAAAHARRRDP
jgi:hypothetical protein